MQNLLKKAQTILDVDLRLMVESVLDEDDLKLLSDYIRLLHWHADNMNNMIDLLEFSIHDLTEQANAFRESAQIQLDERQQFKQTLRDSLSETTEHVIIVGSDTPLDAEIASELHEQREIETDLRDHANAVVDSLMTRMQVAESISAQIFDAHQSGEKMSTEATDHIYMTVADEIERVKQSKPAYQDDNIEAYLEYIRQQLRDARRTTRDDDY